MIVSKGYPTTRFSRGGMVYIYYLHSVLPWKMSNINEVYFNSSCLFPQHIINNDMF